MNSTGIIEGQFAGVRTVGVSRFSNNMEIESAEQAAAMNQSELQARHLRSRSILSKAGATYVVDDISNLADIIRNT